MSSNVERSSVASGVVLRAASKIGSSWSAFVLSVLVVLGAWVSGASAQPVNDNFTNAISIGGFLGSVNGTTTGATAEPGEPNHWPFTITGRSAWYSWVAPADGTVTFDTQGSSFDTILAVYTGSNVAGLTLIRNDDDSGFSLDSQVVFFGVAGTTYRIAVDGYNYSNGQGPSSGAFRLNWSSVTNFVQAPTNQIQFAATDFSTFESSPGFAVIIVSYGGGAAGPVTVDYATADGTAVAGTDYVMVTNTLTFQVGESNKSFTVPIFDNAIQNSNKTVLLSLSNPTGGPQLGALSSAVLTILDDETTFAPSQAGVFNFSSSIYIVTENETTPAPFGGSSLNTRSARGAIVTVTRTGGAMGRVLVDVGVFANTNSVGSNNLAATPFREFTPVTNTLVFDDYQMSASFLVPVRSDAIANGHKNIQLQLSNPRPDPTEDPLDVVPTVGFGGFSTIRVLEVNMAPLTLNIERATYRVDEFAGTVTVDITRPPSFPNTPQDIFGFRMLNSYGYVLQAGSDYTDQTLRVLPNTPYTDGFGGITNTPDYNGPVDFNVTFPADTLRVTVTLAITNDNVVEFNEDIRIQIYRIPSVTTEAIGPNATAAITILYDEQPAGQADREWDAEGISSTQPPFNTTPGANNTVAAVAVQPDGRTVIVGDFTAVNSVSRFRVARMNLDGALDLTFNPGSGADGFVEALVLYPTNAVTGTNGGKILIGGGFSAVNNVSRHGLARLNANGTLDNSFNVGNGADGFVHSIDLQSDGKVLVAGDFTHWNDLPVAGIMRLNSNGSLDTSFNPGVGVNNTVWSVAVRDTAQAIFVPRDAAGTDFEDVNVVETGATAGTMTIDYDFLTIPDNIRVFYEGNLIRDLTTNGVGRLILPYGTNQSTAFTIIMNQGVGLPGTLWAYRVSVVPVITARTIYIGGDFTEFNGFTRNGVARLLDNGTLDPAFDPGLGVDGSVFALAVQPDNKLLVGGAFHRFHTSERNSMVRLLNTGALDADYNVGTGFNDSVYCITLQPDNKALVGGIFQEYNGTRRMGMARLFVGGSLDTSFLDTAYNQFAGLAKTYRYDPPRYVNAIALQPDGNIMIGGSFTNLGGNFSGSHSLRNNYTQFTRADKTTRFNVARLIGGYTGGPGNIEFDPSAFPFTIDENAGVFYATMRRVDGRLGTAQIIATNSNIIANSPADFVNEGLPQIWPEFAYVAPFSVGFVGFDYFAIPITEDVLQEGDETFSVGAIIPEGSITLGGEFIPLGVARGHLDASIVTIADNDFSHGVFNFNVTAYLTNENAGFALITVIRTNGSSGGVSVDYLTRPGLTSPATTNADFSPVRGTLSFSAGQTVRTFQVPIVNDSQVEFDETITLVLTNATGGSHLPGGTPTSVATATLTIIDNDFLPGRLNFATLGFTNNENDTLATIIVTRTGGNVGAMAAQVRTTSGTATNPADYTGVTNTLSWADGDSSAKSFTIPLVLDGRVEGTETVNLFLYSPTINGALGSRTNATLFITDADNFGALSFSQPLYEGDENGSAPIITVTRSGGIAGTVSVSYATSPLTATPVEDYNDTGGILIFLPGETSHTFIVPIVDDAVPDGDKSVQLSLSNPVNGTLGAISNSTLTFVDNESLNVPAGSLDNNFSTAAQVNEAVYALALQNDGRIIMAGDFTLVNNVPRNRLARIKSSGLLDDTFDVGPGANGSIRALTLQADGKILLGGFFTVINTTNRNHLARLATDGSLDAFFNPGAGADNPVYAITVQGDDKIVVGGSFATFNGVVRPGIVRLNTNGAVDLGFNPGAGINGTVYAVALQNNGKILVGGEFISFNGVARTNLIRLNANGSLDNTFNPALAIDAGVRALLVQPDGKIVVGGSFTNVNGTLRHGLVRLESTGSLDNAFLAGLSGADDIVFDVKQQVDGRLLVAGAFRNFNGVTRRGITRLLTDGTTDPAINFGSGANAFVAALLLQPDRRIVLGGGFTEYDGQPRAHITRIYGGSTAGSGALEFSLPEFVVSEASTNAVITVRRRGGTAGAVSVDAFTSNGSAVAGVDYLSVTRTLNFPPGETRQVLNVPIIPNNTLNGDRTVQLGLANFVNAVAGPQPLSTLIIQDDETSIGFASADFAINENAISGNATVTLVRQGATGTAASVNIATLAGGTATPFVDYIPTNATVFFAPGETMKLFNLHVINDTNMEGNESILLRLSNPSGTTSLGISNAVLNLVDDDFGPGQFTFSTNNFIVFESAGVATITVLRTNGSTGIASVLLTTSNGTATAFLDYIPTNRVLTFGDGETIKTLEIPFLNDAISEVDETILLTLSTVTGGASLGSVPGSVITILDDDTPHIVASGSALGAESFVPTNSVIEPGETVTLLLALRNAGFADATNVTAGLVYANGVSNTAAQTQNYGLLPAGGNATARPFTFTASGTNGSRITATLLVTNGGQFLGPVAFEFVIGQQNLQLDNTNLITINDNGPASPYPATIVVSGAANPINRLTVTLRGLTHNYPGDLDILLVAPNGAAVMLMSDAGSNNVMNNVTLTFSNGAPVTIPNASPITNGTYRATNWLTYVDPIPPFPNGTVWTNSSLATFQGLVPNGVWSLYIVDDSAGDSGIIAGGWSLNIFTADTVVAGPDLALAVTATPSSVALGGSVTYRIAVTNFGLSAANSVVLTNLLPTMATFVSVAGPGSYTLSGNTLSGALGSLAVGAGAVVTVTMTAPLTAGTLVFDATAASAGTDLNSANNHVVITTSVADAGPVPLIYSARMNNQIVLRWAGNAANVTLLSSVSISGGWTPVTNAPVFSNGVSTVTLPADGSIKFFRLRRVP